MVAMRPATTTWSLAPADLAAFTDIACPGSAGSASFDASADWGAVLSSPLQAHRHSDSRRDDANGLRFMLCLQLLRSGGCGRRARPARCRRARRKPGDRKSVV